MGRRSFLPTGRFEPRIDKTEVVELLQVGESPIAKVEAITENVSSRGARVIADSICAAEKTVLLNAPEEQLKVPARVVYCQRLLDERFAVGLELKVRVEKWQKLP